MKTARKFAPLAAMFAAVLSLSIAATPPAYAQSASAKAAVDSAKSAGKVGEQADGFLGVVSGADTATRSAVAEINAGRAQAYQQAAARTGVSAAAAGQATAQQLFARLTPGEYYRPADGGWTRK